ncbi:MAG: ABC transporter permease [Wenzhouxiangellaceae bacterium]
MHRTPAIPVPCPVNPADHPGGTNDSGTDPPRLIQDAHDPGRLLAVGAWTLAHGSELDRLSHARFDGAKHIDATGLTRLDASGALVLGRLIEATGQDPDQTRLPDEWRALFELVIHNRPEQAPPEPARDPAWVQICERVGRSMVEVAASTRELLAFLGITMHRLVRALFNPRRLRLTATIHHMEQTGLDAVPLLMLLAALVGAVVAFLGATILRDFGAQLFVIDLVSFAFVREFGVMLTAILLAGRTASAYCAQIGTMKTREEIDAMRAMGLDQIELLVLPRLIALLVTLPLLSFLAILGGLFGGLLVSIFVLGIDVSIFIDRVEQSLSLRHYLVGMLKAPLFAVVIALIGCMEGLRVSGSAQSVGEHTTIAVVRSLTMVIVLDALAAVYFQEIGW